MYEFRGSTTVSSRRTTQGDGRRAVIVSCLDNLLKGASGQAVQNMNVMLGLPETISLEQVALFP